MSDLLNRVAELEGELRKAWVTIDDIEVELENVERSEIAPWFKHRLMKRIERFRDESEIAA